MPRPNNAHAMPFGRQTSPNNRAMTPTWITLLPFAVVKRASALALFTTANGNKVIQVGVIALLFGLVCLPNGIAWALFGRGIAGFLADDRRRQWFNIGMAVLLVVSVTPTLFE